MIDGLRALLLLSFLAAPLSALAQQEAHRDEAAVVGGSPNIGEGLKRESEPGDTLPGWLKFDFATGVIADGEDDLIPLAPLVPESEEEPAELEEAPDSSDGGFDVVETSPALVPPSSESWKGEKETERSVRVAIHQSWWFWAALSVGAAVAGGTAYAASRQEPELVVPSRSLGYVNWR